jgi:hypothetical protein
MENLENDRIEELDAEGKQDAALEKAGVRYCDECHAVKLIERFPNNGTVCDACTDIICQICKGNMPRSREEIGFCEGCEQEIADEKAGKSHKVLVIYDELIPQVQAKAIQSLRAEMAKADSISISNEVIANFSAKWNLKYYADGTLFVPGGQQ